MNVLVTGSAGFVGEAAVEVLRERHVVRGFDVRDTPNAHESVVGDIRSYESILSAMEGVEGMVHLAMASGGAQGKITSADMFDVNVKGTYNVMEAARQHRVRRIVHMSSGAVVTGYGRDTYIHATIPHRFAGLYALTKSLEERICENYADAYGMAIVILRPWGVVDSRANRSKHEDRLTSKSSYFGLVCRYDLGRACALALENEAIRFDVFHIMPTLEARKMFDYARVEHVLGLKDACDFEYLKEIPG